MKWAHNTLYCFWAYHVITYGATTIQWSRKGKEVTRHNHIKVAMKPDRQFWCHWTEFLIRMSYIIYILRYRGEIMKIKPFGIVTNWNSAKRNGNGIHVHKEMWHRGKHSWSHSWPLSFSFLLIFRSSFFLPISAIFPPLHLFSDGFFVLGQAHPFFCSIDIRLCIYVFGEI